MPGKARLLSAMSVRETLVFIGFADLEHSNQSVL